MLNKSDSESSSKYDNESISVLGYEYKTMNVPADFSTEYMDFTIDGVGINEIALKSTSLKIPAVTTAMSIGSPYDYRIEYLNMLKGNVKANLLSGRTALYACAIDGDLLCDLIGCRIEFKEDTVTWHDFAWDTGDDEARDDDGTDFHIVDGLTSYTFDRTQYNNIMDELIAKAGEKL
jgi:hypothetical protein